MQMTENRLNLNMTDKKIQHGLCIHIGKKLHAKEIELNYQQPTNKIDAIIDSCNSGDKILIYDGNYTLKCAQLDIKNDIMLLGVGNNVNITADDELDDDVEIWLYASTYMENINFNWIGICNVTFGEGNVLWMNNVNIIQWRGIGLYQWGKDAFINECDFDGTAYVEIQATSGNTIIQRCKFKNMRTLDAGYNKNDMYRK
eukprot:130485_1